MVLPLLTYIKNDKQEFVKILNDSFEEILANTKELDQNFHQAIRFYLDQQILRDWKQSYEKKNQFTPEVNIVEVVDVGERRENEEDGVTPEATENMNEEDVVSEKEEGEEENEEKEKEAEEKEEEEEEKSEDRRGKTEYRRVKCRGE